MTTEDFNRESTMAKMWRRVQTIARRARVHNLDDTGPTQAMQLQLSKLETLDPVLRLAEYGFTSSPPTDSDAVIIFVGGDRANGVAIATGHRASRLKNLQRGEAAIYDDQGRFIWIKRNSIEIEAGNKPVDIKNATVVTVNASTKVELNTPLLKVNGDIQATGNITSGGNASVTGNITSGGNVSDSVRSIAADRAKYNAHVHGGVTAGAASTGTTSQPE